MTLQALSLGLYIHVPFCANKCAYCHFFKTNPTENLVNAYFKQLEREVQSWKERLKGRFIETIFWGGGSPSCLSVTQLERLGALCTNLAPNPIEWTVEVSPVTISFEKLCCLKQLGVTRISMGVQSFNSNILKQLGRKQTRKQVFEAYEWIRQAGFNNINLDLIFPPDFSKLSLWQNDLEEAVRLNPEHISTYCLTYESEKGPFIPEAHQTVDVNQEADFYEFTWNFLPQFGYQHYEVSNFAKPGLSCKHNVNTWRMQEWIGLGPSAASQWQQQRFQNHLKIDPEGIQPFASLETLDELTLCKDCLIFGLRMCEGIDLQQLQQRFPNIDLSQFDPLWQHFQQHGWIEYKNSILHCTSKGLLLADSLALEIL